MTEAEYQRVKPVIELSQRLHHSLQQKLVARGVQPIDALIAGMFATYDLASQLHGPVSAREWMRDAIDTIEQQQLSAVMQ